jgi:hypothetical protein
VKRLALAVVLLAMVLLIAPETARTTPAVEQGYASAYDPGVMEAVVVHRERHDIWRNEPPRDLQDVDGYIAAMDCSRVGQVTTLYGPDGRAYSVLVADCAGADGPPDRFSRRRIIAELDGRMWAELTAAHGTPLAIGLR